MTILYVMPIRSAGRAQTYDLNLNIRYIQLTSVTLGTSTSAVFLSLTTNCSMRPVKAQLMKACTSHKELCLVLTLLAYSNHMCNKNVYNSYDVCKRYTALRYTTIHYTPLHYTALYYTTLHNTTQHYTTLCYTTLHLTTLHQPTTDKATPNNTSTHKHKETNIMTQ